MEILINKDSKVVVKMEGGLGAQILSAGIYLYMKYVINCDVYLDSIYFTYNKEHKRPVNNVNGLTLWPYQLDEFDLPLSFFASFEDYENINNYIVFGDEHADGTNVILKAFQNKSIKNKFFNLDAQNKIKSIFPNSDYACLHIRQGDYLSVASHLIDNLDIIDICKSISNSTDNLYIISDGEIPADIINSLSKKFININSGIGGDPVFSHFIMRNAKYLVIANSQYSLSAALLNDVYEQIYMPIKWVGDKTDPRLQLKIDSMIKKMCSYSVRFNPSIKTLK